MDKKALKDCLSYIKEDKWDAAHNIAQEIHTPLGSLLHGFLHEIEGDQWNAEYWYRRAGIQPQGITIEEKLNSIEKLLRST